MRVITPVLATLLMACQSPPDDERIVQAALESRSWPATSVLVVERGAVLANVGHLTPAGRDPGRDLIVVVLTSIGGVAADAVEQAVAAAVLGVEAARPIGGEPPSLHAGRFDVGPFIVDIVRRGDSLWLESPAPGPRGRLIRVGAESYALDGDPWGVMVHLDCAAGRCAAIRLHMAGMEWPGRRVGS